jgi:hypothetical protein
MVHLRSWGRCALALLLAGCGSSSSGEEVDRVSEKLVAPTQVNSFAVLASGHATFFDRTQISGGNVGISAGAGDSVTVWFDGKVGIGKATLAQRIVFKDRVTVGDLFANTLAGSVATYSSLSPYAAPPAQPAIPTFTAGSTPVNVNGATTLAAGNYGAVTVNGTLTLSGGTYQLQSLSLNNYAVVQASAASIVRVAGKITGGNFVRFTPTGSQPAGSLRLIVAGATDTTGGIVLGTDAILKALVVSRASVVADARLTATGAIASKDLSLGHDSTLTFATGFECNADAGCDDSNPCTVDSCVDAKCLHPAVTNGASCPDDGNACTSDACAAGVCAHPALANGTSCPSDSNACTFDRCNAGACTHPAVADGTACASDGQFCTADVCTSGACSHATSATLCGEGDAQPTMSLQARWIYANGRPVRSFSYQPIGSASPAAMSKALLAMPAAPPSSPKGHVIFKNSRSGAGISPSSQFVADDPTPRSAANVEASSTSGAAASLVPPNGPPEQTKTLEIRNATAAVLGERIAYSIVVRAVGMGNFFADRQVAAPGPTTILAPGEHAQINIDLVSNLLVRTPHMAAKADFAVGLHRLQAGDVPEATPYAYVGVQGFYYNYTDDYTGVYTYGLERPPSGGAPDGRQDNDGLVERYRNHVLGGNMFEPDGFFGDQPAADARAAQKAQFFDRHHAVWGMRPSTHDVDPTTGALVNVESALPPEGTGGVTNPYDPTTGPTTLCFRWPVSFIDKGTEAYPAVIADAEWNGLVDFVPASYGLGQLFKADGSAITLPTRLDELGCLPAQQLGTGNYLFRVFTADIEHNGTRFEVKAAEPVNLENGAPFKIAPTRAFSLTASLYIWQPGGTFHVQNGYWSHTTNVVGIAHHTLRRHFSGIDLGLVATKYKAVVDDVDCDQLVMNDPTSCQSANFASVSHFSPGLDTLFVDANADVWTHDARWKFVSAHELGHEIQDQKNASLAVGYKFDLGTNRSGSPDQDPASSQTSEALKRDCSCNVVDEANRSHCIQSIETSESAANEGFGHFFATRLWNRVPGEADYDGTCNFTYYKQTSSSDLVSAPQVFPVFVDCSRAYAHRDTQCNDVFITDKNDVRVPYSNELDWLSYYWKATTSGTQSVTQLLGTIDAAITAVDPTHSSSRKASLSVENFISQAPSASQPTLTSFALACSVQKADP